MTKLSQSKLNEIKSLLEDQEIRDTLGIKGKIYSRIYVSAKNNLVLSDKIDKKNYNGAIGLNEDGTYFYIAGIRGNAKYGNNSIPHPIAVQAKKTGITVTMFFPFENDIERRTYTKWKNSKVKYVQPTSKIQNETSELLEE